MIRSEAYEFANETDNWLLDAEGTFPSIFKFKIEVYEKSKGWIEIRNVHRAQPNTMGTGVIETSESLNGGVPKSNLDHIFWSSIEKVCYSEFLDDGTEEIIEEFSVNHIEVFREYDVDTYADIAYNRIVLFYDTSLD